ncbi:MAG: alkylation response protein AidB-like acyl-CoA dehydrogenase [Neolewinella sp.]|jgi:alkylation response protein AidB-like acyl-CoA dehydrogenase|tara:strand:- start:104 stop:1882 length:1779 start_codon:yes stop_codon:yes gene_type:complete
MSAYKAPVQEFSFILEELVGYEKHSQLPGYQDVGLDMLNAILPEAAKFFEQVVAPTNLIADGQKTHIENGGVVTAPILDGINAQMVEAGWSGLSGSTDYDGSGFPGVVDVAVQEMLQSANMGLSLLPMLTRGVIHAIHLYGSEDQKNTYLTNLISGAWSGTMNLTEPQAGSDLSAVQCKAEPNGEHYLISGQKIYITWGDHQQTDNIIHLVLARLPGAPAGNHGISLFLVPKFLVNADGTPGKRNDVYAVGVEHKLGIHCSPTCTMAYGDNGGAVGYLVGPENQGLMCMFSMMNNARLSVGHQGVAIGERAYQQAVWYAADRVQGKVQGVEGRAPIIHHGDVKRMLLQMRGLTEAGRALSFYTIAAEDRSNHYTDHDLQQYDQRLVEILTPLVKGWCTEVSMEVTSLGVQVHGGMGFVEETGAAQHMRDARILPIYEGTNGIQGLDFIGRKCLRDGGEGLADLLAEMTTTAQTTSSGCTSTNSLLLALKTAIVQCQSALDHVLANPSSSQFLAYNFMMLFGNSVGYWLLVRLSIAAKSHIEKGSEDRFYRQKIATTEFFASQLLTRNAGYLGAITGDTQSYDEFMVEDFYRS